LLLSLALSLIASSISALGLLSFIVVFIRHEEKMGPKMLHTSPCKGIQK
jgi:hypothetical protein